MTEEQILEKGAESFRKQCLTFRQIHDIRTYQYGYLEATKELQEENEKLKKCLRGVVYMADSGLHTKNELAFARLIAEAKDLL